MSLAPVVLDDLEWQSMVDAIRRRIPAASAGQWTLHSPVDPGVTLLELYAWLIEKRIFWIDQVPEPLVRASLRLLGVRPHDAQAARTLLRVSPQGHAVAVVPRRTQFLLDGSRPDIRFTNLYRAFQLDAAPDRDAAVVVSSSGRQRSLDGTTALPLFSPDGAASEVRFDFTLASPPPASFLGAFGVFLDLEVGEAIAPSWHPDAARAAPPAHASDLRWWCSTAQGRRELTAGELRDDTLGFRRPGLIHFRPSAQWTATAPSIYSLWVTIESPAFAYPPRLWRAVPNVLMTEHRREVARADQSLDWLPIPGRKLPLMLDARRNRDGDGPLAAHASVSIKERDGAWHTWRAVDDFVFSGPDARAFVVDRVHHALVFGDGYRGRLPSIGTGDNLRWRVWMGGGMRGNVGASLGWSSTALGAVNPSFLAQNVVPGIGGAERETMDEARTRARELTRRVTRAVTAHDFETLACATPGVDVARARAAVGKHPCHACPVTDAVTVYIVPWAPRVTVPNDERVATPVADQGMLRAVRKRFERTRLIGTQVFVMPVEYRAADLAISLLGERDQAADLQSALTAALADFLDPLIGGDSDPAAGWEFGAPLRPSTLVRRAQEAVGAAATVRSVAISLDGSAPEDCHDVDIGANALPWLRSLAVHVDPAPQPGALR
jgi:hypothetical protein